MEGINLSGIVDAATNVANAATNVVNVTTGITHRTVVVNGISMHVAEQGEGEAVLFLHGFPDIWYSWRHQIAGLADCGYRAIAPDLRGYGDTTAPPDIHSYTVFHIVGDLIALLDALSLTQVFVVAHDWGAVIAWNLFRFRPDRVKAAVVLSVPLTPRVASKKPVGYYRSLYGEDYYICKFQEPGLIEAEFDNLGVAYALTKFFAGRPFNSGPLYMNKDGFFNQTKQVTLPSWITQQDINYYVAKYEKSSFTGPLNYYCCLNLNWELIAPWGRLKIEVPVKFIVGDQDLTYHMVGVQEYIHKGGFKKDCPQLKEVIIMEGVGHFIQQEKAKDITKHIYEFINKYWL